MQWVDFAYSNVVVIMANIRSQSSKTPSRQWELIQHPALENHFEYGNRHQEHIAYTRGLGGFEGHDALIIGMGVIILPSTIMVATKMVNFLLNKNPIGV